MANTKKAKDTRAGIRSVARAFEVLNVLKSSQHPCRLADIARATKLTPNLAHAYLVTLQQIGFARQDRDTQRYSLGEAAINLGLAAIAKVDVLAIAPPVLRTLNEQIGYAAWVSVWSDRGPIVAMKSDGVHATPFEIRVGSIVDISVTANGRTFIAYLDPKMWRPLLTIERARLKKVSPNDKLLRQQLAQIREQGMCTNPQLILPDGRELVNFAAIAAPVFDYSGRICAVLTVAGGVGAFDDSLDGTVAKCLREQAAELSKALGARIEDLAIRKIA